MDRMIRGISAAEQKRRKVFDELTRRGDIPPRLKHSEIYAHPSTRDIIFVDLPRERVSPTRRTTSFVLLGHSSAKIVPSR